MISMQGCGRNNMENKMLIAIRADSSREIGSGHIMRCLTLADCLKKAGGEIFFISMDLPGNICDLIKDKGYPIFILPFKNINADTFWVEDAIEVKSIVTAFGRKVDMLIVDHYGLDSKWESALRSYVTKIMVIDDLANRIHDCDLLLDQNFYISMNHRYNGLVPNHCKLFLGPQYVLLRDEFLEERNPLRKRNGKVKEVLIFFGGSDPTNETYKTLQAIKLLDKKDIEFKVVVGMANPRKEEIKRLCSELKAAFFCQVSNIARLMSDADLAIGAGGTATWERCYLGLPSLIISVAENQIAVTEAVAAVGAALNMGCSNTVTTEKIYEFLQEMIGRPDLLQEMSQKAAALMKVSPADREGDLISYIMEEFHAGV